MIYNVRIPQAHLLAILQLLEQVPAPMVQTRPIWDNLKAQLDQQDEENAIQLHDNFRADRKTPTMKSA